VTERQQIQVFDDELQRLIDRFADEFELTYASIIGTMQMKQMSLHKRIVDEIEGDG